MSIVGTISAVNGNLTSTLTNSDLLNPTLDGSYSDDYQLVDVVVGQLITIRLESAEFDTYLQLVDVDTGEMIAENDDYDDEVLDSELSFIAAEGVNYVVRVSGYDESELGTYQLAAISESPLISPPEGGDGYGGDGYGGDGYGGDGYGGDGYGGDGYGGDGYGGDGYGGDGYGGDGYGGDGYGGDGYGGDGYGVDGYGGDGYGDDGINIISVFDGYLVDTLSSSDSLQPTLNGAYSDDYLLTDVAAGQLINVELLSFDFDTYLQLIDADTGTVIAENDGSYDFEAYASRIEFVAAEGIRYIVRASGINETELGTYELFTGVAVPQPDLNVINNITIPAPVSVHSSTSVSWTVQNIGEGPAFGYWDNMVILSKDEFISEDDVYVGYGVREGSQQFPQQQFSQQQPLAGEPLFSGESYNVSSIINIDNAEPGSYYLLFTANESGELPETNLDNNVVAVPIEISGVDANLTVIGTAPTTARMGENINVSWTVNNIGSQSANAGWYDRIYLSDDEFYDENEDDFLISSSAINNTPVLGSDGYIINRNISLSSNETGSRYLLFITDYDNDQNETDESDNVYASPIEIQASDLTVIEANVGEEITNANSKTQISWTVKNIGDLTTNAEYWYDRVYWSKDDVYDSNDTEIRSSYVHSSNAIVAPGATYNRTDYFNIPEVEPGTYYVLFYADRFNREGETDETNNVKAIPIEITNQSPNLTVTNANAPNTIEVGNYTNVSWSVSNSGEATALAYNWYDQVYLSTDNVYDNSDLEASFLYSTTPQTPLAPGDNYIKNGQIKLPRTEAGNYYLLFYADSRQDQGEIDETDNVWSVPIEVVDPPNLIVSDAKAPTNADPNYSVPVSWNITNTGEVAAKNNWYDRVYLSTDDVYDDNDKQIVSRPRGSRYSRTATSLEPGDSYTVNYDLDISDVELGNYYLIFVVDDQGNSQIETDETDNTRILPIELISSNVDLNVNSETQLSSATLNETVTIDWTVTNEGTDVALASSWTDKVYVSNDQYLDASDLEIDTQTEEFETLLGAGDSYTTQRDIHLSNDIEAGNKYLLFVADSDNEQIETNEINNIKAVPISLNVPDVDLSLTVNSSPVSAAVQSKPNISWTVSNKGTETAKASSWRDYIYISDDEIYDEDDDQYVGYSIYNNNVPLEAGQSYSQSRTIDIPKTEIGERYLLFISDFQNSQSDINKDNNTVAVPIDIKAPNLVISDIVTPSKANKNSENINVSWKVTNTGNVTALTQYWNDRVYLSTDDTYDSNDIKLADFKKENIERRYYSSSLRPGASYNGTGRINIPNATPGDYYLLFITDFENRQGETDETDNIQAIPFEVFDTTNITPTNASTPPEATLNDTIDVTWTVTNTGSASASATWYDYIYLSEDETFGNGDDVYVTSLGQEIDTFLASGESYTASSSITIPKAAGTGDRYLLFVTDRLEKFAETDETDNVLARPIKLDATNITVTDANPPSVVSFNEILDLSWTVTNTGEKRAGAFWFDYIYLSNDAVYDDNDTYLNRLQITEHIPLAGGDDYTVSQSVKIPRTVETGNQYILFITDKFDTQGETDETDNTLALPIEIKSPDLSFGSVQVASQASANQTLNISWTVNNIGDGTAYRDSNWRDYIYISDDAVYDSSDRNLKYQDISNHLAAGESYTFNANVRLLDERIGSQYILFVLDQNNVEKESNESNNVYAAPINIQTANLEVSGVSSPAEAVLEQKIPISWTVTNTGNGDAFAPKNGNRSNDIPWKDLVYLSKDEVIDENDAILINNFTNTSKYNLASGDSYSFSRDVYIPDTEAGEYYLLFATDVDQVLVESDESDNVYSQPITIGATNLEITPVNPPTTLILNQTITASWTVSNTGNVTAPAEWYDFIYISDDPYLDDNDIYLESQETGDRTPLAGGDSYTATLDLTIPDTATGDRYLLFVADRHNRQGENNEADNTYALPVNIAAPNLIITDPQAPQSVYLGEAVNISWKLNNTGTVLAPESGYDWVFISDDPYLDDNDLKLVNQGQSSFTNLNPGNSYTIEQDVTIPRTTIGDRYLLFVADRNNVQGETDETDNVVALPINITALDVDLEVSDISAPLESFAGEEIEVVWTVTNNGSDDATDTWLDRIYLTLDPANIKNNEIYGSFEFTGTVAAGQSIERRQKITLPQTLEGDFKLVVQNDVNDSLIEYGKEDNNVKVRDANLTSILPTFANLQVSEVIAPSTAFSSQSTVVEWTVANVGDAATSAPRWQDSVWLSLDQNFDGADIKLGQADNTSYLNPGDSYTNSLEVDLPQGIDGNYYFFVQTDWGANQVFEFQNENDNLGISNISDIELTPPPDLQVRVNAPSNAFSGQLTAVSWTVTNEGQGRTLQSSWYDELYLSTDTTLDSSDEYLGRHNHSGVLKPGESYTVNEFKRLFRLPEGVSGDYYFIVRTDAGGQVYESALSANNTGFDETATQVFLTPPPDIEISVDAPDTGLASNEITLYFNSDNYGATPVTRGSWTNKFYLSEDEQFDSSSDVLLGSRNSYESYGIGSSYLDKSIVVTLPDGISGDYYIFAQADSDDAVFELDKENNIAFDTITIDSQPADLIVSEVIATDVVEAGTAAKVSWTTINQGTGDTVETRWNDQIWLSLDSAIGNSDDRLLATFNQTGLLKPGESYSNSELITIPFEFIGDYQLYVKTDAEDRVYEGDNETNNTSDLSQIAIARQPPDLQVNSVNAPVTGVSGESFFVEWTVINSGTGKTNSNYWYDEVFLSLDQNVNYKSDISLGKVYHSGTLEANETYKVGQTFELPQNLDRDYYVVVKTDVGNQVLETPLENNNETASNTTTSISLNAVPDLVFDSIDAPTQGISGQTFELSWKVSNQGVDTSSGWTDVFYLSQDQVLDRDNDIYLGSSFNKDGLVAGTEFAKTTSFNISPGLSGPFYVFGVVDSRNSIYERDGEDNNIAFDGKSMNVILPDPADLTVEAISVPNTGVPGQDITINYTVNNQGDFTVNGNWEDAIYLSEDDRWDINDPLVDKVRVFDSVESGESYSRTVNAELPGVATGDYHVIVRSDIRNHVYESEEGNNFQVSAEQININTELLELGGSDTDTIRPGKSIYYRLEVSAGQAIRIKLDSQVNSSSNNVYVRYEQMPTKGQFDFFTEPFTANPELVFPVEQDGTYYVLVTGDDSSAASNFTITAEEIPFSLLDVSTKRVGNVAPFTLEIEGAKFDAENTAFQIVDGSGTIYEATQVAFKDSTTAYATFDLSGQSVGNYDVRAIKNDETSVVLEDVLVVEEGVDAQLFSSIDGPGLVRPGGKYFAKLNYANAGGADEAAPLIILQTPDTSMGLSADSIAPTESLFLLGIGEDLGADVLRAGEINQIPFFFTPGGSVNVNMLRYTEDSSTPITEADWNTIETAIKPAEVADEDWSEFWSTIQPRIGSTWGDYVQVVNDLAKAFSPEAERDYDVRELFAEWYESGDLSVYTPKSAVSVQLIDHQSDLPVAGVPIRFFEYVDEQTVKSFYQAVTDQQGRFQIGSVPAGNYKVILVAGYSFAENSSLTSNTGSNQLIYDLEIPKGTDISDLQLPIVPSPEPVPFNPNDYGEEYVSFLNDWETAAQVVTDELNSISETDNQSATDNGLLESSAANSTILPADESFIVANSEIIPSPEPEPDPDSDSDSDLVPGWLRDLPILQPRRPGGGGGLILPTPIGDLRLDEVRTFEEKDCNDAKVTDSWTGSLNNDWLRYEPAALQLKPLGGFDIESAFTVNRNERQYQHDKTSLTANLNVLLASTNPIKTIFWIIESFFPDANLPLGFIGKIIDTVEALADGLVDASFGGGIGIEGKGILNDEPNLGVSGSMSARTQLRGELKINYNELINLDITADAVVTTQIFPYPFIPKLTGRVTIKGNLGFLDVDLTFDPTTIGFNPRLGNLPRTDGIASSLIPIFQRNLSDPSVPEDCFDDDEHDDDDNNGDLGDYNPAVLVSRDPNDILGPDGFGEEKWIDAEEPLEYTIRFENDPELATAPAQVVRITQQLDEDLDFRTFRLGDFGFGDTFIDVPENRAFYQTRLDLVSEKGIYVDFFAGIDIATGEAFWELRSLDPATGEQPNDPLLGFLPPNLTKPEGDGFVNYSIRTDRDIETGAVIDAEARIIFDINEPIDTPPIFNTIDAVTPTSTVEALPSISDSSEFTISWFGNDDPNGSAIANYTIYVAENDGEFIPWLENTTLTEALFTGTPGSRYQFYAVATDNAGNIEDIPLTSQAQTTIAGGNNPPLLLNPLEDLVIDENSNFSFTISDNVFIDTDAGDALNYSATLADGSPLPLWLNFDEANQTFTGTPVNEDVGILEIEVTATDNSNEIATDLFTLEVQEVVQQPVFSTIGEFGKVSNFNHLRQTIEFNNSYDNPVVFALPLSRNGGDPATVRITNLESDRFTAYLQEPEYKDGWHVTESFSYLVLESGDWMLEDGTLLEVGTVDTNRLTTQGWESLNFDLDFESTPAILSQVQTYNGTQFVRTRQRGANVDGFLLSMEEEEALKYSGHLTETVGWLAIETGTGVLGDIHYQAGHTDRLVDHQGYTLDFEAEFDSTPSLFASLASFYGGDSAGLRYKNLTNEQVRIILEEEQSLDAETAHVDEIVDFLALSGTGDLLATVYEPIELS